MLSYFFFWCGIRRVLKGGELRDRKREVKNEGEKNGFRVTITFSFTFRSYFLTERVTKKNDEPVCLRLKNHVLFYNIGLSFDQSDDFVNDFF